MFSSEWPFCYSPFYNRTKAVRSVRKWYPWYYHSFLLHFENSSEIGAFALLTNKYCLAAVTDSMNFNNFFIDEFEKFNFPVVFTSVANCRILGRLCAGNQHGLLVPSNITDLELDRIKSIVPDSVKITSVDAKMSALGNLIACNDKTAIIHPELDQETVEIITDTLNVEVFPRTVAGSGLVGSYCAFNSFGGLVPSKTTPAELEELADLLQVGLTPSTVNGGKETIGAGITVNDRRGLAGFATVGYEFTIIEKTFNFQGL